MKNNPIKTKPFFRKVLPRRASFYLPLFTALGCFASAQILAQTAIPEGGALPVSAADTSKPGFLWRVHQVGSSQPTTLARTEAQLAGSLGDNIADPNAQGIASDVAAPPNPSTAPIEFIIPTVINLNQSEGSMGNFQPDDQMPGIPGTTSSTDNIAAEVLTWLELPAGEITMGVNSDDGFRVSIGGANPTDRFATNVGEYDSGRGAGDSIFKFTIAKAGLYAARLIWNEGGSDASVEWFTQKTDGTKVLVNDLENGGIKAYRAVSSGAAVALISSVRPGIKETGVFPNAVISAELVDGSTPIDPSTVKLVLDGAQTPATATKNGGNTSISYTPASFFPPASSHNVSIVYTEGAVQKTNSWSFRVANYGILSPSAKVTPDTSKPGFVWNVFANSTVTSTTNQRTEDSLAGLLKDTDGNLLPNLADPAAKGVALAAAAAPNPDNAPVHFEIPSVINLTRNVGDDTENKNGNFTPDEQMPGIPATDGSMEGIAAEIITYIELPAGAVTMGVNSDDAFRTSAGNPLDVFGSILLGEFDAGRAATDTLFTFVVQEPSVYPFRTIWNQGTGPANIEWFSLKSDGTKVLVNDLANGGLKAYRAHSGGIRPYIKSISPAAVPRILNQPASELSFIIMDGTIAVDDASIALTIDGQPVNLTRNRAGDAVTATFTPSALYLPSDKHTAIVTYNDAAGGSRSQQWTLRNLRNYILPAPKVTENFDSYSEGTAPAGWNAINFTTTDVAGEDIDNLESDTYKGWIIVDRSRLEGLKNRIFNLPTNLKFNGEEVTTEMMSSGNLLYAESDSRGGDQVQFIISKPFDLSSITNVVLSFSSLYEQNQDNMGSVEYSVDGGNSWLPVIIYIDTADGGGDIKYNPDGTVDAIATLSGSNGDTAAWVDNGVAKGDKYGDGLLTPITPALGDFIAPRINDDSTIDKRIEVFSLPEAGRKSDVRLRFAQLGTGSWYFGVDNIAFYEGPAPTVLPEATTLAIAKAANNQITLSWSGSGTLQSADKVEGPYSAAASQANPQTIAPDGRAKFYRVSQ